MGRPRGTVYEIKDNGPRGPREPQKDPPRSVGGLGEAFCVDGLGSGRWRRPALGGAVRILAVCSAAAVGASGGLDGVVGGGGDSRVPGEVRRRVDVTRRQARSQKPRQRPGPAVGPALSSQLHCFAACLSERKRQRNRTEIRSRSTGNASPGLARASGRAGRRARGWPCSEAERWANNVIIEFEFRSGPSRLPTERAPIWSPATMTVKIGFGSGVGTSTGLGSMDEKMCSLRACRIERARKLRRAG